MLCSILFSLTLAALLQSVTAQTCPQVANCPTTPTSVPTPWYELDFNTDPRLLPAVGSNAAYNWTQQEVVDDGCRSYHQGLLWLYGSTNRTYQAGPYVDIYAASGPYSAGVVPPGNIAGTSRGIPEIGTAGWSFEITFKAYVEGGATNEWAKMFDLGTSRQQNGQSCDRNIVLTFQGRSDEIGFSTCTNGDENPKMDNIVRDAVDLAWYHIIITAVSSPHGRSVYTAYVNGTFAGQVTDVRPLVNGTRDKASLGRSSWNDDYFIGVIDQFAIYDVVLSPSEIAGLYGNRMTGCSVTRYSLPAANPQPTTTTPPAAFFEAPFSTDITVFATPSADFEWNLQDSNDLSCGITHHSGLLRLSGDADYRPSYSSGQYVNLSATSGENYAGVTLGNFGGVTNGAGSVSTLTAGFSIEISFKPFFVHQAAKILAIGNTDGSSCTPGDMWLGWEGYTTGFTMSICNGNGGIDNVFRNLATLSLQSWYHLVITAIADGAGRSTYTAFLNGQVVAVATNQYMLPNMARRNNVLGRSNFFGSTDTYWSGYIDKFAVYNQALTVAQTRALASSALYNNPSATTGTSTCPQRANTATSIPSSAVFYTTSWPTDPRQPGSSYNYTWLAFDSADSATDRAIHTGIIRLGTGVGGDNVYDYVNMSQATGPFSTGQPIGNFGGLGTGNWTASTMGWSFEMVFKVLPTVRSVINQTTGAFTTNGMQWAKLIDFGDGNTANGCENDIVFGYVDNNNYMRFETCNVVGQGQSIGEVAKRPVLPNVWYHAFVTMQASPQGAFASYWLNGQLVENITIPAFPLYASRKNAFIGKSNWNDKNFNGQIELFTIYSQALNAQQAQVLYQRAMTPVSSSSSSTGTAVVSSSSSSSSSTGIAITSSRSSSSSSSSPSSTATVASSSTSQISSSSFGSSTSTAQSSSSTATQSSSGGIDVSSSSTEFDSSSSSSGAPEDLNPNGSIQLQLSVCVVISIMMSSFVLLLL